MRVLVGVDGSEGSIVAVRFIGRLLSPATDEIVLYYSPPRITLSTSTQPDAATLGLLAEKLAEAVFDKCRAELPTELDVKTTTVVGTQSPKHGLLVAADESRAELIVVGARGAGPFKKSPLGSVGRAVVHASSVPVLIVRGTTPATDRHGLRVLLACDGSDVSGNARQALEQFTFPEDTVGRVITVIDSGLVGAMPDWFEEQLRETSDTETEAAALLDQVEQEREQLQNAAIRWCGELPAVFQHQQPIVKQGHASQEILNTIKEENVDLAVVGSRGFGPVQRLFAGSTSEHLLVHAPCSVLIVRQHEKS